MENRNTQCDRCERLFVGNRGLNIHRSRSRVCNAPPNQNLEIGPPEQPELQNQEEEDDDDDLMFFTPEGEYNDTIQLEGYSLNSITIPVDLFQNLENEQQLRGRYLSLIQFAVDSTILQYQKKKSVIELFIRLVSFVLFFVLWASRILGIASTALALYCCYSGKCSPTIHYIMGVR